MQMEHKNLLEKDFLNVLKIEIEMVYLKLLILLKSLLLNKLEVAKLKLKNLIFQVLLLSLNNKVFNMAEGGNTFRHFFYLYAGSRW